MAQYTETTNYDLRKPVPNDEDTRDKWGTDINRNILSIDKVYNDIQAQIDSTDGITDTMLNVTIPAIEIALSSMLSRIQPLINRLVPYLDNPDCEAIAQGYLSELEVLETWIDAQITRLQRFNSDTYFKTVTTDITTKYNDSIGYKLEYDNGLLKSFEIS